MYLASILSAALITLNPFAWPQAVPEPTPVPLDHAYIPAGFDSNDQVQMVVEGWFRASCYRFANAQIKIDYNNHIIRLKPIALMYGGICLDVMVPFHKTIDIGILPPGEWAVLQSNGGPLGRISVAPTISAEPDDNLYASVSQAYLDVNGAKTRVVLAGEFNNSCMRMDDIRVIVEPDVIVVLPIARMVSGEECRRGRFPFEEVVPVNARSGRYLLHVRSMNGNAINNLIDVP